MGMGNNPQFRVKTTEVAFEGKRFVRCEHPTEPGTLKGGWMGNTAGQWEPVIEQLDGQRAGEEIDLTVREKHKREVVSIASTPETKVVGVKPSLEAQERMESPKSTIPANAKYYTEEEVAQHNSEEDCWIIVKGKVYDTNAYLKEGLHPGGNASITMNAGEDTTEDFEAVHSAKAWKQLEPYYIGEVGVKPSSSSQTSDVTSSIASSVGEVAKEVKEKEKKNKKMYPPTPTTGNVDLVKHWQENKDVYGDVVLGEEAEALAFDRMWAGASHPVDDAKNPRGCSAKKWIPLKIEKKVGLTSQLRSIEERPAWP